MRFVFLTPRPEHEGFDNAVYSQLNDICHELGWPRYMAERPDAGKLTESPHYVFGAKIYTSFCRKQPDRSKARAMYVYCLPYTSEQCDYPPTAESPANQVWKGYDGGDWFDDQFWKYEY